MIVTRSALMLHLQNPPIRYHFFSHFSLAPTFPSLFKPRFFSITTPRQAQTRTFVSAVASSSSQGSNGRDTFFAEENVSWSSLGLSDTISRALSNIGLNRPSLVQASSVPSVLSGKDVIIAAETGSGKTYSYLVPLIDKLRVTQERSLLAVSDREVTSLHKVLLVLCPNVQLCEQVVRMANSLCKDDSETIVSAAAICGKQGWPIREPDVIVTTPAALLNYVDLDRTRRVEFMRGVKYVVFDEADLLLCGSFQNKVIRLINLLRFDEKLLSRSKKSVAEFPMKQESSLSSEDAFEGEEKLETEAILEEDNNDKEDIADINNEAENVKLRDWRRVRKNYERSKQYVFVAATLPVNGKKTAGGVLKYMFPDAEWVCGDYLHCHNPRGGNRLGRPTGAYDLTYIKSGLTWPI
ncbi:DEAD-box ATP-dependent RNA helicase 22 [Glycine soja]|uniref:DEAD-box ATP-dependent RNA helicase 22 n=1 Tax=Glycine soja TaxID=3848 RepID=A0A445JLI2_GLYSO|nr:DEAD-box ATP-dependent RNA helicase 22 [Glycine soja]